MFINNICSPAIIYLGFSITQIIIDIYKNMYNTAFLKFVVSIVFTIILNIICERGLSVISWIIVFVPFMFITVITSILLYMFGLDPFFGKLKYNVDNVNNNINNNNNEIVPIVRSGDEIMPSNYNDIINQENSNKSELPINRILSGNNNNNNNNNEIDPIVRRRDEIMPNNSNDIRISVSFNFMQKCFIL